MSQIVYRQYLGESDLPHIMALVQSELSEPYVIYTFRYFLHQWPHLSFLAYPSDPSTSSPVGVIVCKQSMHRDLHNRGYIAMLSVSKEYRKRGIASTLVRNAMEAMKEDHVEEIVLETEYDNYAALSLYESLGFIREKRLYRFYLNGKDAFRLILTVPSVDDSGSDDTSTSEASSSIESTSSGRSALRIRPRRHVYRAIKVTPYSDDDEGNEVSR
ncbi:acyl-CoA N-acyltransferase, partial [Dendrothele bispora CBS 962.96]